MKCTTLPASGSGGERVVGKTPVMAGRRALLVLFLVLLAALGIYLWVNAGPNSVLRNPPITGPTTTTTSAPAPPPRGG